MNARTLGPLYTALYALVKEEELHSSSESRITAGHSFEDETARIVYSKARECGIKAFPPRQKFELPTVSGNSYQFDASFSHGNDIHVVECKRRQIPALEHVYYFGSKVLDHRLAQRKIGPSVKGAFLSSVKVGESSMQFGFAFGLLIIDPENPPLSELYARCKEGSALGRAVLRLQDLIDRADPLNQDISPNPMHLLKSYEYLKRRVLAVF